MIILFRCTGQALGTATHLLSGASGLARWLSPEVLGTALSLIVSPRAGRCFSAPLDSGIISSGQGIGSWARPPRFWVAWAVLTECVVALMSPLLSLCRCPVTAGFRLSATQRIVNARLEAANQTSACYAEENSKNELRLIFYICRIWRYGLVKNVKQRMIRPFQD
jgi:hypothetical protein